MISLLLPLCCVRCAILSAVAAFAATFSAAVAAAVDSFFVVGATRTLDISLSIDRDVVSKHKKTLLKG